MKINQAYVEFITNCQKRYAVLMGGAGSGKSRAAIQKIILRTTTEANHRILCVRKVATTLRNSVYQDIIDNLILEGIKDEFTINKSEMRFTHKPTGNEIILHGMDDQEKIKSIAGLTSVWCEEATELDEADFNQLELRLRGFTTNYKQFIVTFNPISDQHWLKARFFDNPDEKTYLLRTTYKNNAFLDQDYIDHLTTTVKKNPNLYKVYVLGEWGKTNFGGEFLKSWSSVKHAGKYEYRKDLALYLSFDENVNPYFPCGFFQSEGSDMWLVAEIAAKTPDNTVPAICREVNRKLKAWGHREKLFICGDSTSRKEDVKIEKGSDMFKLICNELKDWNPTRKIQTNPSVRDSADFFNEILANSFEGLNFYANENCRTAVQDYENTKEDKNGKVDKTTVENPVTKVRYQPFGHFVDLTRYVLVTIFANQYAKYKRGLPSNKVYSGSNLDVKEDKRF